jgi:glutamate racemase
MTKSERPLLRDAPIGVFDSGLGGLTVARAIRRALPHEDLVYLGDTARVPYGTRSAETVIRYARSCARMLESHGIKLLVVACNTVSAVALDMLRVELDMPVLGVIEPGARAAVKASETGRIAVIATNGTVASFAYPRAVASFESKADVKQQPAPLLVPLVEEGWLDGEVPELVVRRYLAPLLSGSDIDALVLGCTHYPLLEELIAREARALRGAPIAVVDSGVAAAHELESLLADRGLRAVRERRGTLRLLVTDRPGKFAEVASRFLGETVEGLEVEQVDL